MGRLELKNLCKRFSDKAGVDDVSLDLPSGSFLTLLGPSGSGKTTTLMMIAGFLKPDSGSIKISGKDIVGIEPNKRGLGIVFQSYALFPHKTVFENVAFPLKIRGISRVEIEMRVKRMLQLMQLDTFSDSSIVPLSGGQKQRVALARALVFEPPILLMDEPLGALDRKLRERMQIEIKAIQTSLKVTTVYVTHDQDEALSMSDVIAIMDGGRVIQIGTPASLYEKPANRFVAEFLGGINILPVNSVEANAGDFMAMLESNVRVPCQKPDVPITTPCAVGIRPERLHIGAPAEGFFDAEIMKKTYLGDSSLYELDFKGSRLTAKLSAENRTAADVGSTVSLSWAPESALLLR